MKYLSIYVLKKTWFSSFFDNFFKDSKNHQIVSKKNSKIVTSNSGPITSLSLCTYIFFSFSSNGSRGNEDSHHASNTLQTLKRLSSLHHFYAKPWATQYFMPNEAAMRPKIEIMHDQEEEEDGESW